MTSEIETLNSQIEMLGGRVDALEQRVAQLKQSREAEDAKAALPWWDQRFGAFANSEAYDAALRLGREYRESQQVEYDDLSQSGHGSA